MEVLSDRERAYFGPRTEKEPGSVPWCWQTIDLLKLRWERKALTEGQFETVVEELRAHEVWNVVPPHKPYGSLEALLEAEIGCTEPEARRTLQTRAMHIGPQGGRPQKTGPGHVSTRQQRAQENGISQRSQSRLDYVASYAPELLPAIQDGSLPIKRAYLQAKGQTPETPLITLHRVWRKLSQEDRLRFLQETLTPAEWEWLQRPKDAPGCV